MSSRALSRCGISEGSPTLGRLVARGVHTAAQLLRQFSALELSEALDLSPAEAAALLRTVSGAICPPARRASDLLSSATGRRASVGLPALDAALRGGLPGGALTELVGPAGVGKTQACLQAAARSVTEVNTVIYIDTENKFNSHRFLQIAEAQLAGGGVPQEEANAQARAALQRIILIKVTTLEDMLQRVGMLEAPCIDHNVVLIIVDSIAHLARTNPRGESFGVQDMLGQIAASFKKLSEALDVPVMVVNQVSARFGPALSHGGRMQGPGPPGDRPSNAPLGAALGTAWAHAINTRLVMEAEHGRNRSIRLAKSPTAPCITIPYRITEAGLVVDDSRGRLPSIMAGGSCLDGDIANDF